MLAKFDQCGKTDILGQIVNGVEAAIGEFPWLANNSLSRGDRYYGYKNAKEIGLKTISREEAEERLGVKIKDN